MVNRRNVFKSSRKIFPETLTFSHKDCMMNIVLRVLYRKYLRGVAQFGRALRSGRRGRVFESRHPDFESLENRAFFNFADYLKWVTCLFVRVLTVSLFWVLKRRIFAGKIISRYLKRNFMKSFDDCISIRSNTWKKIKIRAILIL